MQSISVPNWSAFTAELDRLRDELADNASGKQPELLFRGQSDSSWTLMTTLERADCEGMSFDEYYRLAVTRARPTIEAFTGVTWDVPDYDLTLEKAFRDDPELFSSFKFPSVDLYRYMIYLRHHGFPSPLLDWTSSMYVAAFFAFRGIGTAEKRSIYVYCERPHGFKGGAVGEPAMRAIGKYVRTHARHFRQHSDYTMCAAFDKESGGWRFHRHDPVFWSRGKQDFLWKFDLPSTERTAILKSLDEYNLNAFSLFDSQEALLETVWSREQVSGKVVTQMNFSTEMRLPLASKKLAVILKEHGYETHPRGMAQPLGVDVERSSDGETAFFDVNADAVRKDGEVPERPIRLTFNKASTDGSSAHWKLKSVVELAPGVKSKALDRQPETPKKNAPWPR
jgi:FRG domain